MLLLVQQLYLFLAYQMTCVIIIVSGRLVIVGNVSAGPCGVYRVWPSGLPAGRIKDDRRSG